MTVEILDLMQERSKLKNQPHKMQEYKQLCRDIQRNCRNARGRYLDEKCKELEELDAKHNPKLYSKIKELKQQKPHAKMGPKNKEGKMLQSDNDVLKRWQEYVTELYSDKRNEEADQTSDQEMGVITVDEVQEIIKKLPKGKPTGEDDIPAEFLQCCGSKRIKTLTSIVNQIYSTGEFLDDFLSNIFIPIPKTAKAMKCEEYRTICLISHACKIVNFIS